MGTCNYNLAAASKKEKEKRNYHLTLQELQQPPVNEFPCSSSIIATHDLCSPSPSAAATIALLLMIHPNE